MGLLWRVPPPSRCVKLQPSRKWSDGQHPGDTGPRGPLGSRDCVQAGGPWTPGDQLPQSGAQSWALGLASRPGSVWLQPGPQCSVCEVGRRAGSVLGKHRTAHSAFPSVLVGHFLVLQAPGGVSGSPPKPLRSESGLWPWQRALGTCVGRAAVRGQNPGPSPKLSGT